MKVKPEFPANPCLMQRVGDSEYRPNKPGDPTEYIVSHGGMSIRTELAARAMEGLLSKDGWTEMILNEDTKGKYKEDTLKGKIVAASVAMADALIAELNKPIES